MTAETFYALRAKLARAVDRMLEISSGGPFSALEAEDCVMEISSVAAVLDEAWRERRPNLRVVK